MCAVIRFIRVYVASIWIRIVFRPFTETRNQQWWRKKPGAGLGSCVGTHLLMVEEEDEEEKWR